jgi:hypothetical protein
LEPVGAAELLAVANDYSQLSQRIHLVDSSGLCRKEKHVPRAAFRHFNRLRKDRRDCISGMDSAAPGYRGDEALGRTPWSEHAQRQKTQGQCAQNSASHLTVLGSSHRDNSPCECGSHQEGRAHKDPPAAADTRSLGDKRQRPSHPVLARLYWL